MLHSMNKAYLEMNYKKAAAVKYGETVPVLVNGKQVKISITEKPKTSMILWSSNSYFDGYSSALHLIDVAVPLLHCERFPSFS